MTNYSDQPGKVKIDFYKPGGKWYMTEVLDMSQVYLVPDIFQALSNAMDQTFGQQRAEGLKNQFVVVVDEPYHKNAYPLMLQPDWMRELVLSHERGY